MSVNFKKKSNWAAFKIKLKQNFLQCTNHYLACVLPETELIVYTQLWINACYVTPTLNAD